jgi:hypothetical protein
LRNVFLLRYTPGMKTAVSIPDSVYADADRLARRMGKSRSQLYSEALAEYVARHSPEEVTEAMNKVCAEVDSRPDPAWTAAARRVLERSEWS